MRVHQTGRLLSSLQHGALLCLVCLACIAIGVAAASAQVAPAPAPSTQSVTGFAEVKLRDALVFSLRVPRESKSAEQRASSASRALLDAAQQQVREVRVETVADTAVIYAGEIPIVHLREDDARAAGDPSLAVHAASIATKVRQALQAEHTRAEIANRVFSISLMVFLGLLTLYVLKRSGTFERRLRTQLLEHPERVTALKVHHFEVLGRHSTRLLLIGCLSAAKWLLRGAVLYGYLVFVLTQFTATRGFTEQVAGWVLAPVSSFLERLMTTLPVVAAVVLASAVVWLLLRLSHLFFSSISEGETQSEWLRRESALALGRIVGIAIIGSALLFAAPVVTGQPAGAFANIGTHLLLALSLAAAPILASAGLGVVFVLRGPVKLGDRIECGSFSGMVRRFGLLDLTLIDEHGDEVRIPYLKALVTPLSVHQSRRVRVTITVHASASPLQTLTLLRRSLHSVAEQVSVTLVALNPTGAHYEISALQDDPDLAERLLLSAGEALQRAEIPLAGAISTDSGRPA